MDKLKDKYFSDPKAYGKAMELLMLYDLNSESSSWEDFEVNFLTRLDEDEDNLLGKALKMRVEKESSESIEQKLESVAAGWKLTICAGLKLIRQLHSTVCRYLFSIGSTMISRRPVSNSEFE